MLLDPISAFFSERKAELEASTNNFIFKVNDYGVREYKNLPFFVLTMVIYLLLIALAAYGVLHFEKSQTESNVSTYRDAFWLCHMAASTIGFGDHYTVTDGGRFIIGNLFVLGGAVLGVILNITNDVLTGWRDTDNKNYELAQQNNAILRSNMEMAETLKMDRDSYQKTDLENGQEIKEMLEELLAKKV